MFAPRRPYTRPRLQLLEDRTTPALIPVTNLLDTGAGSLRAAIAQANTNPDFDVIVFDAAVQGGVVSLTTFTNLPASTADVPQPAGPSAFLIISPVTIRGTGETITRTGAAAFRLFQVTAGGSLTLENLTLSNGLAQGGAGGGGGGGAAGLGGAVYNQGTLSVLGCTLTGNQAVGGVNTEGTGFGGGGGLGGPGHNGDGGPPNGGRNLFGYPGGFGGGGGNAGGDFSRISSSGGFGGGGGFAAVAGAGGFGGGGGGHGWINAGPGGFGGGRGTGGWGGGGGGMGGAVFNQGGTVTIANSTVTGNNAKGGDAINGGGGSGFGGGLFNLDGTVTLTNDTFAGNTVTAGVGGDGVGSGQAAGGAVYNLSITALVSPGGASATPTQTATVTVANSILAASTGGGDVVNRHIDGTATISATGPNLVSVAVVNTGGAVVGTSFLVADPNLGPLADNGGPTQMMPLLPGSPAIDAGDNAGAAAAGLTTDQRGPGFARVSNGVVDLGAFEVQVPVVAPGSLPAGQVGIPYSQTLTASGPPGPFTFTVTAGVLPPGLTLGSTGALTGTPTQAGTFAFTAAATNGANETGSRVYTLTIDPLPPALAGGPPDGTARVLTPAGGSYALGDALTFFPGSGVTVRVAAADVTGDGVADFVGGAGPGGGPRVAVIDGATGERVADWFAFEGTFTGGIFVAAGDLDGDGKAEVVVTPDRGGGPVVAVFDGTGAERGRFLGIEDPSFRGGARPALGDVNGDGAADLVVSAGFLGGPRVAVFDGKSIAAGGIPVKFLPDFFAFEDTLRNGAFMAAGDVSGDGFADLAFGGGSGGSPRVRVFDGTALVAAVPFATLDVVPSAQLADFFAGDSALRGGVRVLLRDADGDGRADLIAGSGEGEPSRVRIYSAANLLAVAAPAADQELDPFGEVLADGVFVG
jgi:hypothetical protein